MSLNCLVCDQHLDDAITQNGIYNQPYAGTTFTSTGHYGSTVWDPSFSSREWLEINICDPCLTKKADEGVILHVKPKTQRPEYDTKPWDPASLVT